MFQQRVGRHTKQLIINGINGANEDVYYEYLSNKPAKSTLPLFFFAQLSLT